MKDVVGYLPWIGLAVGLFSLFLRGESKEKVAWLRSLGVPVTLAVLSVVAATQTDGDVRAALIYMAAGALLGCLFSVVSCLLGTSSDGSLLSAMGLAAFLVGTSWEFAELHSVARLAGLVIGLGVAALPAFGSEGNRMPAALVTLVFVGGVLGLVTRIGYREEMQQTAVLLAWSILLALGLSWGLSRAMRGKFPHLSPALALVAIAGLTWLVLARYLGENGAALVGVVSVAAVAVTAWAVPVGGGTVAAWGVSAVVWLGMATFAFSESQGYGMAVAGLVGVGAALAIGRRDVLPPIGVVVGLATYRLFRENNADIVQAFDIGQHYALIGFLLGIVVLVAVADAMARRKEGWGSGLHGALIGLIAAAIVVGASAFFGPKGSIGLMVGLAVAPVVSQLTSARPPWTFAAAAVLQCAVLVAYRPLAFDLTLDRDGKGRLVLWFTVGIVVLYAVLMLLSRKEKEGPSVQA